jgi:pimeloyl-ACP methyl ester carboxylesterase
MRETRYAHLHGFASSAASKKGAHLSSVLARRGIALALPDLNRPSFAKLSAAAMLAELDRLHADAGSPRWRLSGSSLGGWLAARWAEAHPDRVEKLVLLCPAFDLTERWRALLPAGDLERWKREGELAIDDASGRPTPVHLAFFEEMERERAFPDVPCPTTIVHGTRDDRVPVDLSRRYAATHRDVELIEVDDGHDLMASLDTIERAVLARFELGREATAPPARPVGGE